MNEEQFKDLLEQHNILLTETMLVSIPASLK